MNKNNFLILSPLILLFINTHSVSGQARKEPSQSPSKSIQSYNGVPIFTRTRHNFGDIQETNGKVTHVFELINNGPGKVKITNVITSCGCTASEWTTEDILPGGRGVIRATYDPTNRPGPFNKDLIVYFKDKPSQISLYLTGQVKNINNSLLDIFNTRIGNLRFMGSVIDIKRLKESKIDTQYVSIYNPSQKRVIIQSSYGTTRVRVSKDSEILLPETGTQLMFTYNPKASKDIGMVKDELRIITNDDSIPTKIITIRANIVQDFDTLTAKELKKSPQIAAKDKKIDLGEVYLGEVKSYKLEITNTGKSDLVIRNVYGSCGCTVVSIPNPIIKKKKKGIITVQFNGKGMRGWQEKTITIISNDPNNSVLEIPLKANVVIPGIDPIKN